MEGSVDNMELGYLGIARDAATRITSLLMTDEISDVRGDMMALKISQTHGHNDGPRQCNYSTAGKIGHYWKSAAYDIRQCSKCVKERWHTGEEHTQDTSDQLWKRKNLPRPSEKEIEIKS